MGTENREYKQLLLKWCEETEAKLIEIKDQLLETMEEKVVSEWEQQLTKVKNELQKEVQALDSEQLFQLVKGLYEKLKVFLEIIWKREKGEMVVPIGGHQLPPLPYTYDALQPVISEETMRLHHLKHHQSYVDGLNKAELQLKAAREANNYELIKLWSRELAFNGAGHYLHTIFWTIMSPTGGGQPDGELLQAIKSSFGSYEMFKKQFTQAAEKVEGGGWALLVWSPRAHRLEILTAEKHQNLSQWDVIPLLVVDVWEHAYYLQYKNERANYINNWWNIVNWPEVEKRFHEAKMIMWKPY